MNRVGSITLHFFVVGDLFEYILDRFSIPSASTKKGKWVFSELVHQDTKLEVRQEPTISRMRPPPSGHMVINMKTTITTHGAHNGVIVHAGVQSGAGTSQGVFSQLYAATSHIRKDHPASKWALELWSLFVCLFVCLLHGQPSETTHRWGIEQRTVQLHEQQNKHEHANYNIGWNVKESAEELRCRRIRETELLENRWNKNTNMTAYFVYYRVSQKMPCTRLKPLILHLIDCFSLEYVL